jgi:hypothetical protein
MSKRLAMVCALAIGVGCNNGGGSNDSGVTPPDDMGGGPGNDAACVGGDGGVPTYMPLAVPMADTIDLSCRGHATIPMGGASTMATLAINEYLSSSTPITATMVDVWTNDMIGMGACSAPNCTTVMTDMMGHATLSAPLNGLVAYHIYASSSTAEVLAYGMPWAPNMGTVTTAGFASTTINTVSALLGRTFRPTCHMDADCPGGAAGSCSGGFCPYNGGAVSGQVTDCMGHDLQYAEARVYMGTTRIMTGPTCDRNSPRITGLDGTAPVHSTLTGSGGTFVGANVPASDSYRVEVWGVQPGMTSAQLIGCEEGRVVAGGITVLAIGPLRSDYAAGSACAMAAAANP